ncbi:MAG: universal stress protein [Bryobacterales bacterium]|nr:universal stress protein [Bryobacterales bacterium]
MFRRIVVAVGRENEQALRRAGVAMAAGAGVGEARVTSFHVNPKRQGDTLDELLQETAALEADLLVVGARSHVTARRLAMLAPCSVLMVPEEDELQLERVLVPVDFSEASAEAVREGWRLARAGDGDCTVLAVESDDEAWLDWRKQPGHLEEKLKSFVADALGGLEPRVRRAVVPLSHSTMSLGRELHQAPRNIEGADIATTIVGEAGKRRATLVVMGTRGRTLAASILLGSVTEKVVQISRVPVLAVKRDGERLGLLRGLLERLRAEQPTLVMG